MSALASTWVESRYSSLPQMRPLPALLNDAVEEATEDIDTVAVADLAESRVVRKWLVEVIAQKPSEAESIGCDLHELALGAQPFEEHDELKAEEDDRVDGRASARRVAGLNKLTYKGEVDRPLNMTIEMVARDKLVQRDTLERFEPADFGSHHGRQHSFEMD